jgi:hypothetical protein
LKVKVWKWLPAPAFPLLLVMEVWTLPVVEKLRVWSSTPGE